MSLTVSPTRPSTSLLVSTLDFCLIWFTYIVQVISYPLEQDATTLENMCDHHNQGSYRRIQNSPLIQSPPPPRFSPVTRPISHGPIWYRRYLPLQLVTACLWSSRYGSLLPPREGGRGERRERHEESQVGQKRGGGSKKEAKNGKRRIEDWDRQ